MDLVDEQDYGHLSDSRYNDNWKSSGLSDWQEKMLTLAYLPSSVLSLLGSGMIVYLVLDKSKGGPNNVYKRILLGMSIVDIFLSTSIMLQAFLMPSSTSSRIWSFGSEATCNAMGFLTQLATAGTWYTGMLSFYFLLTIRYNVSETELKRRYEPWMHGISLTYSSITATVGLAMNWYGENELGGACWLNEIPKGCATTEQMVEDGAPWCYTMLIGIVFALPLLVMFIALLVNNLLIYWHVKKSLKQPQYSRAFNDPTRSRKRLMLVSWQCVWYVMAFWVTYIWFTIIRFLEGAGFSSENEGKIFVLLLLSSIFSPLQGAFNLLIYIRPRFLRTKEEFSDESTWWIVQRALFGASVQPKCATLPSSSHNLKHNDANLKLRMLKDGTSRTLQPADASHRRDAFLDSIDSRRWLGESRLGLGELDPKGQNNKYGDSSSSADNEDAEHFDLEYTKLFNDINAEIDRIEQGEALAVPVFGETRHDTNPELSVALFEDAEEQMEQKEASRDARESSNETETEICRLTSLEEKDGDTTGEVDGDKPGNNRIQQRSPLPENQSADDAA